MIRLLKPLSFIPALVMMYMIFSFSSQDGVTSSELSYKVSYEIVEIGGKVLGEDLEPWQIDSIATRFHGIVRKLAHMTEYFLLAVAVSFPLYVYGLRGLLLMFVAGMFCVAFACGDEYHQSYVSGRSPSARDVAIDSFGVFWGIVLVRIVGWTGRKTIFRPFIKKKKKEQEIPEQPIYYGQPPYGNQGTPQNYYRSNPNNVQEQHYYRNNQNSATTQNYNNANSSNYNNAQMYQNGQQSYYNNGNSPYNQQVPYGSPHYVTPPMYGADGSSADTTSDKLSEDMSLKKLVHDIKDKKKK